MVFRIVALRASIRHHQDDYVTNGGAKGFEAPTAIRADQVDINGVRLPYLKFPRNPTD